MDEKKLFEAFKAFLCDFKDEVATSAIDEVEKRLQERLHAKVFYTLKEVEQITGISYEALKGRIKRKTLFSVKDGNIILIPKDELNGLIDKLNRQYTRIAMRA